MADESSKINPAMIDSYIRNQTGYLQASILHADQKAAFLMALVGLLAGYLEARAPFSARMNDLFHGELSQVCMAAVSAFASCLLMGAGAFAAAAVWPRFKDVANRRSASFFAIAREFLDKPDEFANELAGCNEQEVLYRQLISHHNRCGICRRKWIFVRVAYAITAIAVVPWLFCVLLTVAPRP